MTQFILAIDQGTTSTRALLVDARAQVAAMDQHLFEQHFPKDGWVEHDPEEIWSTTLASLRGVLKSLGNDDEILAVGITNQRETTLVWDKQTGQAIYPAIVWQDRRTSRYCRELKSREGLEQNVQRKTGLLLDPYFSASKIRWILDHVEGAKARAESGDLLFGTVDSFLIWRLTQGRSHVTDVTNASRTLLFNIETQSWDEDLLSLFGIPRSMLPEVKDNCADFGVIDESHLGIRLPITGVAGDQQAAAFGQACFEKGMIKSTYGTGCFVLVNTGETPVYSAHRLLTTVLSRINGKVQYALEGSIFVAGAAIKWLHEKLAVIESPAETETLAASLESNQGVYMVPAFTGLGAPYWDPKARASLMGMTRDTGRAAIARSALEAVAYQTNDLFNVMKNDGVSAIAEVRVDGGMTANRWFLEYLSNTLNVVINKPRYAELTALGAAFLAGLHVGFFESLDAISTLWESDNRFLPDEEAVLMTEKQYQRWLKAVNATQAFAVDD